MSRARQSVQVNSQKVEHKKLLMSGTSLSDVLQINLLKIYQIWASYEDALVVVSFAQKRWKLVPSNEIKNQFFH
jgi:hypothetical protein